MYLFVESEEVDDFKICKELKEYLQLKCILDSDVLVSCEGEEESVVFCIKMVFELKVIVVVLD